MNFTNLFRHPLIHGSSFIILGGLLGNFFNFIFYLYMSRTLTVADYGILASSISLINLPALAGLAIAPLINQFAGAYFAKKRLDMVRGVYLQTAKFFLLTTSFACFCMLIFLPQINTYFHITNKNVILLTDVIIFFTILNTVNVAFLQAKLSFRFIAFVVLLSGLLKLLFGISLVYFGFAVIGAIIGVLLSVVIPYMITFFPLKFIFNKNIARQQIDTRNLFSYGIPSALSLISLTSLISMDIILVKHFFDPQTAGIYAGLSLIGRVIFLLTAPINSVMFPVVVQQYNKGEKYKRTFLLAMLLVLVPSVFLTIFYTLFPEFTILFFLKKAEYLQIIPLLTYFALFITCYSLLMLIVNFYLSLKKNNIYIPIVIGAISQIIFINIFHKTFFQIITISFTITLLLLIYLLLYYVYIKKKPAYAAKK